MSTRVPPALIVLACLAVWIGGAVAQTTYVETFDDPNTLTTDWSYNEDVTFGNWSIVFIEGDGKLQHDVQQFAVSSITNNRSFLGRTTYEMNITFTWWDPDKYLLTFELNMGPPGIADGFGFQAYEDRLTSNLANFNPGYSKTSVEDLPKDLLELNTPYNFRVIIDDPNYWFVEIREQGSSLLVYQRTYSETHLSPIRRIQLGGKSVVMLYDDIVVTSEGTDTCRDELIEQNWTFAPGTSTMNLLGGAPGIENAEDMAIMLEFQEVTVEMLSKLEDGRWRVYRPDTGGDNFELLPGDTIFLRTPSGGTFQATLRNN